MGCLHDNQPAHTSTIKATVGARGLVRRHCWRQKSSPFPTDLKNVFYLGEAEQEEFGRQFKDFYTLIPWNHFGRKNIGYVFAIHHGAQVIWDFGDDNIPKDSVRLGLPDNNTHRVSVSPSCLAYNPYPDMGSGKEGPPAWPRGFPLTLLRAPCNTTFRPEPNPSVSILQSLADHDPDVDAIYRLTRTTPFNFSTSSQTALIMPKYVFAPYNAQATLIFSPAFWSLLLPVTVHGRVSDIWRSYIAQRLMWDVGGSLAFSPPLVTQLRNPHNYLADMQSEQDLYFKSDELLLYLRSWSSKGSNLPSRFQDLVIDLYERDYVGLLDVQVVQNWLSVLDRIGYSFPQVTE